MKTKSKDNETQLYDKVGLLLGIDVRSLAAFRICIGTIMLVDLVARSKLLTSHYSDSGILSREVLMGLSENPMLLSINMLSGDATWQAVVFVCGGIAAVMLTVGYKTRVAVVICWLAYLSIHVRNPFVNNLGDWFLLDLLIWGTLLPLGSAWSIDVNKVEVDSKASTVILSVASLGIMFQVVSLYVFSVFYKISPIWHTEGTAVYYALNLDRLVTPIGNELLKASSEWLNLMTFSVLNLERWGWVILFVPGFNGFFRMIGVICFISFHVGLIVFLHLGIFPFICISAWLLFVPGSFWDRISRVMVKVREQKFLQNRNRFSSLKSKPNREQAKSLMPNGLETLVAAFLLWSILSSNLVHSGLMGVGYYDNAYRYVEPLINSLNLRQRWNMFSPHPAKRDGWFVFAGETKDGRLIDVFKEGDRVDWRRPSNIANTYRNQRWRKNLEWVMDRWDPHARLVASYLLNSWNQSQVENEQIVGLYVYFIEEYTLHPGEGDAISDLKVIYKRHSDIKNEIASIKKRRVVAILDEKNTGL